MIILDIQSDVNYNDAWNAINGRLNLIGALFEPGKTKNYVPKPEFLRKGT